MRQLWVILGIAMLAGSLAGCGGAQTASAAPVALAAKSYGFKVEISGLGAIGSASDVRGLALVVGSKEYVSGDGRDRVSVPDGRRPTVLSFAIDLDDEAIPAIKDWVQDTYDGKEVRKDLTINVIAPDGSSLQRFELFECWPSKWSLATSDGSAAGGTAVRWTLEVRVNRISMA